MQHHAPHSVLALTAPPSALALTFPGLVWAEREEDALEDLLAHRKAAEVRERVVDRHEQQREEEPEEALEDVEDRHLHLHHEEAQRQHGEAQDADLKTEAVRVDRDTCTA